MILKHPGLAMNILFCCCGLTPVAAKLVAAEPHTNACSLPLKWLRIRKENVRKLIG